MISAIKVKNFKCFKEIVLPLGNITLLSGLNSAGKSSLIHAMLALRQSYEANLLETGLLLNGELVKLGQPKDVLYSESDDDSLGLSLVSPEVELASLTYSTGVDGDLLPLVGSFPVGIKKINIFASTFHYLNAERTGPRANFSLSQHEVFTRKRLGKYGEYCAHFLSVFERMPIPIPELLHPSGKSNYLRDQVEAWLGEVSPGVRVHITSHGNMDVVNLQFSFSREGYVSDQYRASNVGFALTYSLPIFVAALSSTPGTTIVVENPEAHLHPRAQVQIAILLARAAKYGVQVIIETHSDHILNGLRLAVANNDIPNDLAKILFFKQNPNTFVSEVKNLAINPQGRIDEWPQNFFDEWDKAVEQLIN